MNKASDVDRCLALGTRYASLGAAGRGGERVPDHALRAGVRGVRASCARAPPRQYRRDAPQSRRHAVLSTQNTKWRVEGNCLRRNSNSAHPYLDTFHKHDALAKTPTYKFQVLVN